MTPVEALERAIGNGLHVRYNGHLRRRFAMPGSVVASMPAEDRAELAKLTPSAISSLRRDIVALHCGEAEGGCRQLKLSFDRKLGLGRG